MPEKDTSRETQAIRSGDYISDAPGHPVSTPIFQSVVWAFDSVEEADAVNGQLDKGYFYYRYGSPNQLALEKALADWEGAEAALATGSGMSAVFAALASACSAGDHIIADSKLYGGTLALLNQILPRFGITITYVNTGDAAAVRAALQPTTKVLYFETISNPLVQVADLTALAGLAKDLKLTSIVDATFTTPALLRPLEYSIDVVVYPTTKYIGGHSDAFGGILAGPKSFIDQARSTALIVGLTIGAFDAWLDLRSVKTLALRMEAHSRNALAVAQFLEQHPQVKKVYYPGLETSPQYKLAHSQMPHGCGGMLAFEVADGPTAREVVRQLKNIPFVPSLADVATTVSYPATTSHKFVPPEERAALGITDGVLRLSVGIEDVKDIIAELKGVLDRL